MSIFTKFIVILFTFSMLSANLFAQYGTQVDNRGFEQWTTRGENSVNEPVHWHSGGTATGSYSGWVDSQIESSTQVRPGSSGFKSVRLFPDRILGVTANGNMTNGRMNAGSMSASGSNNYNYTQRSQSVYNTPFNQSPDSLSVWVCFRSQSTTDKAMVKAIIHGDADYILHADGSGEPANMHVATAQSMFTRTSTANGAYTWRRLSIPFQYNGPSTDPRYILFSITTNQTPGSGGSDDDLFVDDILIVYNPTLTMGQLAFNTFYQYDPISIPFTLTGTMSPDNLNASANVVIAQMSDANGSFNNPTELGRVTTNTSGNIVAHIPNVAAGQYMVRVISTNYPMVGQNIQSISVVNLTYIISASANPSDGGTVSGAGEYEEGASCTLTATANPGYTFTNWTENGNVVSTNASYTFNVVDSRNLVANFSLNTYTINATANPSAGGSVSGAGEFNHGQSCTLTASANSGYMFANWTENGTVVSSDANYTFTVTGNRNLVANFTLNTYTISVAANPTVGGTVYGAGTYNHGESCTVSATAHTGFTFANWTESGNVVSTDANYTFTVTGNRNLVAHFTYNTYTVTVSANPSNGGTVTGGGTYDHSQNCTVNATAATGYTFTNWTENGSVVSSNASYTFSVTGDRNLVANFTLNTYTITASANPTAGGTVSGSGSYTYGQNCTVNATPATGYTFTNWTENGSVVSTNASYSFTVEGNRNLVANFTAITYTITVSANPSYSGTATGGGTYAHGQSCTVIATSADGYTFLNWTENGSVVSNEANYTYTVTGNRSLVANFEEQAADTYNINVSPNPNIGGTVTGGGSYEEGQQCTVTATANTGYTFINWTENGDEVSAEASYSFIVVSNRNLVANFTLNTYNITVIAEPEEGGIVNGMGDYSHGESCTLTAVCNENYIFVNWTKDGVEVSADSTYTFIVTASEEYVAHFQFVDNVNENVTNSQIFPHPFISKVSIIAEKDIKSISVYDLYGRLLKKQSASGLQLDLDLSGLSAGIYLLQIDYGDSQSVHQIMKSR